MECLSQIHGKRTVQPEDDAVVLDVYSFQTVAGMLVGDVYKRQHWM